MHRGTKMAETVVVDVSEDWAIACDVQRRFMEHPTPVFHGLSYTARCRQLRAVGGDFYDFIPLSEHCLGLAIGDASGKSIAAALTILGLQSSLRTAAAFAPEDPATMLRIVNSHIHATSLSSCYATVFYGVYEGNTKTLRYVNAGHNPPVIVRRDGSTVLLETGGVPTGIFADSDYEEEVVQLRSGDLLVAYTDGVTEATNAAGEEWGLEGMLNAMREARSQDPEEISRYILEQMDEFSGGCQTDDATVVIARVQ